MLLLGDLIVAHFHWSPVIDWLKSQKTGCSKSLRTLVQLKCSSGGLVSYCFYGAVDKPAIHHLIISIIYSLIARVVGAAQMILQPVFSVFPCSPLPTGTCRTPGLSISWCCLPTSSSVCLVFPFHCALQDGFGETWWMGDMTIPLQFASLYDRHEIFVWSNCLLDLGTDVLVGNMVFVWDA